MSLAEVQNIREHQMKRIEDLELEADAYVMIAAFSPTLRASHMQLAREARRRAHELRVQLAIEDAATKEQTK